MNHFDSTRCHRSDIRGPPEWVRNKILGWGARRRNRGKTATRMRQRDHEFGNCKQDKEN